jgi:FkbM family methyltransferase
MQRLKKIAFLRYLHRWLQMARGMDSEQMWGRTFDLSQKRLVNLDGFDLYVMPNDYIGYSIIKSRTYESHVTRLIRNTLGRNDVFLDIGANVGYFTMLAWSMVKGGGKVLAFEPNPQNLQLMYSSVQRNCAEKIEIYPYAVSNAAGILRFTTVGSNGGVVTKESKYQRHFLLVQAVVLDEILKHEPRLDLVKIDIEAHEPFALQGMVELIKKYRPKIITEYHPWAMRLNNPGDPTEYLDQIIRLGYRLGVVLPTGETMDFSSSHEIDAYWKALGEETMHLDLFAQPINL